MPYKDSEKLKEYLRQYREKNKERIRQQRKETDTLYYLKNKEQIIKKNARYRKTPQGKKSRRIERWKHQGIQCDEEWDEVDDWYMNTSTCDICEKIFKNSTDKCLDHDHTLAGYNIRGILCKKCNHRDNEL